MLASRVGRVILSRVLPPHPFGSVSGCSASRRTAQSETRCTLNTHETFQLIEMDEKKEEEEERREKEEDFFFLPALHRERKRGWAWWRCTCEFLLVYIWNFREISAARARACVFIDAWRNHKHTHTRVHTFRTGYTYTRTHDTATNYYYSTITTATITTIIGCLSIRLTPSSGPNYYVTIFIDNKGRNKYWNNNCNKKEKKEKAKWLLDACPGTSVLVLLFRDSISICLFVYPGNWHYTHVSFFSATVSLISIGFNWFIVSFQSKN